MWFASIFITRSARSQALRPRGRHLESVSKTSHYVNYIILCVSVYRGVNMFAMLTATLPYSVNSTTNNIVTLLHAKMLERKMNPIPDHLSPGKER